MELIAAGRRTFPGFELLHLARVGSTQDVVREAARRGAAAGYCCLADEQSSGRGRQRRSWMAPANSGLLVSLYVTVASATAGVLPLAVGCTVAAALRGYGLDARLKWPNDIQVEGKKLAGILVESEAEPSDTARLRAYLGIGINLTVEEFPAEIVATSLHRHLQPVPSRETLLSEILAGLAPRLLQLENADTASVVAEWQEMAVGLGDIVTITGSGGEFSGIAESVDDDGALLVRTDSGLKRCLAGDVHLHPASSAP